MHKILLVDDTRHFLDLEMTFLQRAECRLLTASTGLDAIRIAKSEQPDLILLDIEMPEMNGLQACRILKADPTTQRIPIIVLTSMKMEDEARRSGADHFLRKPIDEPTFLAEVRRFVPIRERSESRAVLDVPVTIWRDGEPSAGQVLNLSRTGLFIAAAKVQPVGARLEVTFRLPHDYSGRDISAEVLVARQAKGEEPRGYGVRFFQVPAGTRTVIEEFLERVGSRVSSR